MTNRRTNEPLEYESLYNSVKKNVRKDISSDGFAIHLEHALLVLKSLKETFTQITSPKNLLNFCIQTPTPTMDRWTLERDVMKIVSYSLVSILLPLLLQAYLVGLMDEVKIMLGVADLACGIKMGELKSMLLNQYFLIALEFLFSNTLFVVNVIHKITLWVVEHNLLRTIIVLTKMSYSINNLLKEKDRELTLPTF